MAAQVKPKVTKRPRKKVTKRSGAPTANPESFSGGGKPIIVFQIDNPTGGNPITVGRLWGTRGKLSFEGDMDTSAKLFFDRIVEIDARVQKEIAAQYLKYSRINDGS